MAPLDVLHQFWCQRHLLSATEESKSYRLGTTCRWINEDRIFIFHSTISLKTWPHRVHQLHLNAFFCYSIFNCIEFNSNLLSSIANCLFHFLSAWLLILAIHTWQYMMVGPNSSFSLNKDVCIKSLLVTVLRPSWLRRCSSLITPGLV